MAKIEDLIDEIADPGLRERIAGEVRELKRTKRFGLVFEEQVPELPNRRRRTAGKPRGSPSQT